jgi:hypothetical protein
VNVASAGLDVEAIAAGERAAYRRGIDALRRAPDAESRASLLDPLALVAGGIAAGRITTVGYGAGAPVAPNANPDGSDNPEGRAQNRRVVTTVVTA